MKSTVTVKVVPTKGIVTICNMLGGQPGVIVEVFDRPDFLRATLGEVATYTQRDAAECAAFEKWLFSDEREPGDHWTVTDEDGDDVASVVLG